MGLHACSIQKLFMGAGGVIQQSFAHFAEAFWIQVGARVLLDCCQSTPHMPINVEQLGADWIVGSGHKMCGPTGVGFLWGR